MMLRLASILVGVGLGAAAGAEPTLVIHHAKVVTVDRDGECLLIYPAVDWEQVERQLMQLASLHARSRRLQRLMVGHATDLSLDAHGRLLLPPELREFAGLDRHAMLIGQGNRCELWDESRWMERRDFWLKSEASATDLPAELDSLSL